MMTVAEIVAATKRPGVTLPDQLAELYIAAYDRRQIAKGSDHFSRANRDARELDAIVLNLRARLGYIDLDEPPL